MKLYSVQILRALAALMVVVDHTILSMIDKAGVDAALRPFAVALGAAGVGLFFGISGFVMMLSHHKDFGQADAVWPFIRKRLTRIVPLYWLATGVYVARLIQTHRAPELSDVALSMLFLPHPGGSGDYRPVYTLGWTLNFEMYFYAIMALCLFAPKRIGPWATGSIVVSVVAAGSLLPLPPAVAFYAQPFALLFALGLAVGATWLKYGRLSATGKPPGRATLLGVELGNASYSIYLTHIFIVGPVTAVAGRLHLPIWAIVPATIVAASVLGLVTYRFVEKPMLGLFKPHRLAPHPATASV